jgi:hypothetical protein
MDTDPAASIDTAVAAEGPYLRLAQTLLAERAELFLPRPARSVRPAGVTGPPQDRAGSLPRRAGRQLTLPLPRDRSRRRLRMVG